MGMSREGWKKTIRVEQHEVEVEEENLKSFASDVE